MRRRLVIGVGNRHRGDDAAGLVVADRLRAAPHPGFDIAYSDGNVTRLLQWFRAYESVLIVDAAEGGRSARLSRWNALDAPLPSGSRRTSSHALGVAQAIELARVLRWLPHRLTVYGIPAGDMGRQEGLSVRTGRAVRRAVTRIRREWQRPESDGRRKTRAMRARRREEHAASAAKARKRRIGGLP